MNDAELDRLAWLGLCKPGGLPEEALGGDFRALPPALEIEDGIVAFKDEEHQLDRAIRHVQTKALIDPPSASALFEALQRHWLEGAARAHNVTGRALAALHNAGDLDGMAMAVEALEEGGDVFTVARMMVDAMPLFDTVDLDALQAYCELCDPRMKNDLMQGLPYQAVEAWLKTHPEETAKVIARALEDPSSTSSRLLRVALVRQGEVARSSALEQIYALREAPNPLLSLPALEALGMLDWRDASHADVAAAKAAIASALESGDEQAVVSAALSALNFVSTATQAHDLIDYVTRIETPYAVRFVGDHLAYRSPELRDQEWYWDKVAALARKNDPQAHTYGGVDQLLAQELARDSGSVRVLAWLDAWAEANHSTAPSLPKLFPQLFSDLAELQDPMDQLVARWLLDRRISVQKMCRHLFDELSMGEIDAIAIPRSVSDGLTHPQLLMLIRRILANAFRGEQQIALVWSLTASESAESRTFKVVGEAMADFVGYNYPSLVGDHVDRVVESKSEASLKDLATSIKTRMDTYFNALEGCETIEELRPPSDARRLFARARQRGLNQAFEEASKNSIFRQIATNITLKAGRSSFSMRDGEVGQVIKLSSMSRSMTLPRSEHIDTVGSNIQRLNFQFDSGEESK